MVNEEANWQEIHSEQFRFKEPGDIFIGVLLRKEKQVKYGVGWYVMRGEDMKEYGILGSIQLDRLMMTIRPGERVRMVYDSQEDVPGGKVKIFRVYRSAPAKR